MKSFCNIEIAERTVGGAAVAHRSISSFLAPLDQLSRHSASLIANHKATFEARGRKYVLPRYLFIGPQGGDAPIRIGLFAAARGDELEGASALVHLLELLEQNPALVAGYCLFVYPICSPIGFENLATQSRLPKTIHGQFWENLSQPEAHLLREEILTHALHGGIVLHSSVAISGFHGAVRGATLTRHLIKPALAAAEKYLPIEKGIMAGLSWPSAGALWNGGEGGGSLLPAVQPHPFEISLCVPKAAPEYLKKYAFLAALQSILAEYRGFFAYARNL